MDMPILQCSDMSNGPTSGDVLCALSPFRQRPLTVGNSSNALVNFSIIERLLEERQLVLLLDYDGTLTPIVRDPAAALLPADVRATLTELAKHFVVGVVSGRSLEKIRDFVKVDTLFYAGSHGFDIHAPAQRCPPEDDDLDVADGRSAEKKAGGGGCIGGVSDGGGSKCGKEDGGIGGIGGGDDSDGGDGVRYQVASEFLPVLQEVREESEEAVKEISGASVEDNLFSISLHYRNCARADVPRVAAIAREVQGRHAGIRLRSGKEVFELQPDIEWNKGSAVVWLLGMLGLGAGPDAAVAAATAAAALATDTANTGAPAVGAEGSNGGTHGDGTAGASVGGDAGGGAAGADGGGSDSGDHRDCSSTAAPSALAPPEPLVVVGGENGASAAAARPKVFTIFIGDDKTDEDAFCIFCPRVVDGGGAANASDGRGDGGSGAWSAVSKDGGAFQSAFCGGGAPSVCSSSSSFSSDGAKNGAGRASAAAATAAAAAVAVAPAVATSALGIAGATGAANLETAAATDPAAAPMKAALPLHEGLGILVSEESRETSAAYTLRDPREVAALLARLADIGRRRRLRPLWCRPREVSASAPISSVNGRRSFRLHMSAADSLNVAQAVAQAATIAGAPEPSGSGGGGDSGGRETLGGAGDGLTTPLRST